MATFTCPHCGRQVQARGDLARCPGCGNAVRIPAASAHAVASHAPTSAASPSAEALAVADEPATLPPVAETGTLPPESIAEAATVPPPAGAGSAPAAERVRVPGYEVLGELGRGGMGVVYQARQVRANRLVALKMILAGGHAGPAEVARFRTEAEAIARLQHPNIVQVYEVGEADGHPFFSLEYCAGGSLDRKLAGTPLPPAEAAALAETLTQAMEAAHRAGVIHRDLKPQNVLLTADGTPKITDFGLAKKLDEAGQTASGAVMGTPSYMAPEQAEARKAVGPAADVYALGTILYECLTGRPPFRAATPLDTILQVVTDEPVPPRALQPRTPRDLETVCLKCLEKDPRRRYVTAAALAEDLRRFQAGEPTAARPVGPLERGLKWVRRRPALAGLAAVSLVAATALLVVVVGLFYGSRLQQERDEAQRQRTRAEEQSALAESQRALAEQQGQAAREQEAEAKRERARADRSLYEAQVNLAYGAWQANQMGQLEQLLAPYRPGGGAPDDLRGFEWYFLRRLGHPEQFAVAKFGPSDLAISPDGTRLTCCGTAWEGQKAVRAFKVWDLAGGREVFTGYVPGSGYPGGTMGSRGMTLSPDTTRLATFVLGSRPTVQLLDARTGEEVRTFTAPAGGVEAVAFSPDGQRLAAASGTKDSGAVKVWDVATGRELLSLADFPWIVADVCFAPDGRRLATINFEKVPGSTLGAVHLRVWDPATGRQLLAIGQQHDATAVIFSPDGTRLVTYYGEFAAASGPAAHARVWDAATGRELLSITTGRSGLDYSPDGLYLAGAAPDQSLKVWDARTGEELYTLRGPTGSVRGVRFGADGRHLVSYADDWTVKVWDLWAPQEARTVQGTPGQFTGPAFSPDGRRLAALDHTSQTVRVWDAATGGERATLRGHRGDVSDLAFSPGDGRLASAGTDGTMRLWDVQVGRELFSLAAHPGGATAVVFRPDGRRLASLGKDGTVKLWDLDTKQEALRIASEDSGDPIASLAFSPDGSRLAGLTGLSRLLVWDAATGAVQQSLLTHKGRFSNTATFGLDGSRLAIGDMDGSVTVWDWQAGRQVLSGSHVSDLTTFYPRAPVRRLAAYSPDGQRLAGVSYDGHVLLWDAQTGQQVLALKGHDAAVTGVAFSPDGKHLASASAEGTVKIWDAEDVPRRPEDDEKVRRDWDRGRAAFAEANRQWYAARWHLDRLLAAAPDDGTLYRRRAAARARLADWDGAARDYARARDRGIEDYQLRIDRGLARASLRQWDAALGDFAKAVEEKPDSAPAWLDRGDTYAELGQWQRAAADLDQAARLQPASAWNACRRDLVHLAQGDEAAYRRACTRLLEQFGGTADPNTANVVAYHGALLPDAGVEPARLVELARKAVASDPARYAFVDTLGAALCRAGHFDAAVERLEEAVRLGGKEVAPQTYLYLALAHQRLGHAEEARRLFDEAVHRIEQPPPDRPVSGTDSPFHWTERMEQQVLRREAENLLNAGSDGNKK